MRYEGSCNRATEGGRLVCWSGLSGPRHRYCCWRTIRQDQKLTSMRGGERRTKEEREQGRRERPGLQNKYTACIVGMQYFGRAIAGSVSTTRGPCTRPRFAG